MRVTDQASGGVNLIENGNIEPEIQKGHFEQLEGLMWKC